jgi:cation diffusion facilitator CzcD-associated flavoprotein CzcO
MSEHHKIVIVGSGFAGLGMGIQLLRDGIDDFVILEKSSDLGGTWRDNTYPGCVCDVPSVMYSWSFAPNPDWTKMFAPAGEIWDYMRKVAEHYGLPKHIRYDHEVREARWNDELSVWEADTSQGVMTADVAISAVGALHEPSIPDLPGMDTFAGKAMHSAQWDNDFDVAGKRVAVIGTGASAIQIVPEIQPLVERLDVYQRTPAWVLPRPNPDVPKSLRRLFRTVPLTEKLARGVVYGVAELFGFAFRNPWLMALPEWRAKASLKRQVPDPELRRKLTPTFRMGCKRVLNMDTYYPALTQPNVDVITDGIAEVRPEGIVDAAGVLHELDVIIFATGFHVTDMPVASAVRGRDGRTLGEHWQGSPKAYFGTAVAGFPNFYMMLGPGTGLGHNSIIYMLEAQSRYISEALGYQRRHGYAVVEPREEAQQRWIDLIDSRMRGTVWVTGGCRSWYLDETGRNSTIWPLSTYDFRRRISHFVPDDNLLELPKPAPAETVAA